MGRRQERVAELIREELGDIFLKEGKQAFGNEFITVSKVRMSSDLGYAHVYLSIMNEQEPEKLVEEIRKQQKSIRMALGKRIRNQIRKIPELHIYYDDTMDYVERMEKIFKEIHKQEGDGNQAGDNDQSNDNK